MLTLICTILAVLLLISMVMFGPTMPTIVGLLVIVLVYWVFNNRKGGSGTYMAPSAPGVPEYRVI